VPAFQGRQLGAAGVPRLTQPWLPGWQRRVLPHRPGGRLVLHHGSGDRAKNLPPATWRAALDALSRELPLAPLVLEGPVERARGADPFGWGAERVASSSLEELLAVLARASLVLGNDSGVTHLAALLGIPTVVAYGPSDPGRWRPLGPRVALVRPPRDCAPCCGAPPVRCEHLSCLGEIPAAALVAAARELLDPDRGPRDQGIHPERR
jgi:ADP-heptose:LPS heptosyltransferase